MAISTNIKLTPANMLLALAAGFLLGWFSWMMFAVIDLREYKGLGDRYAIEMKWMVSDLTLVKSQILELRQEDMRQLHAELRAIREADISELKQEIKDLRLVVSGREK